MELFTVYWYAPPPVNGHPEPEAEFGLKFTMHQAIRMAFQWIGFPAVITDEDLAWGNIFPVNATPPPTDIPEGKIAVDGVPELVDGLWWQRWAIVDAPPVEPPADPDPEPVDPPAEPPADSESVDPEPPAEPETPIDPPVEPPVESESIS
jgi:hypothetical protein